MPKMIHLAAIILIGLGCAAAHAQTAAVKATCKDGTTYSGAKRGGACRGHGGVQAFSDAPAATPAQTAASGSPAAPPTVASPSPVTTPTLGAPR